MTPYYLLGCDAILSAGTWRHTICWDVTPYYLQGCDVILSAGIWRHTICCDVTPYHLLGCDAIPSAGMWRHVLRQKFIKVSKIHVWFVLERRTRAQASLQELQFPPSVSFHQCSILIFHSSTNEALYVQGFDSVVTQNTSFSHNCVCKFVNVNKGNRPER